MIRTFLREPWSSAGVLNLLLPAYPQIKQFTEIVPPKYIFYQKCTPRYNIPIKQYSVEINNPKNAQNVLIFSRFKFFAYPL